MRIGIVAPSAVVPWVELRMGVQRLKSAGFLVDIHPQCKKKSGFFAGTDEERAQAFFEYAKRDDLDVIWSARGGYGSARILPILDRLTQQKGKPRSPKLFLGFSDATAIFHYVRTRWGWSGIHAPMPGGRPFSYMPDRLWRELVGQVCHSGRNRFEQKLKWLTKPPAAKVQGPWLGGNLTVLNSLAGTPYSVKAAGGILFLEDVSEAWYRIDRTWNQLVQSGALEGVRTVVLGTFEDCRDTVPSVLKKTTQKLKAPSPRDMGPLRAMMSSQSALKQIFGAGGNSLGIPVAYGLKVGHGDSGLRCMPWGGDAVISPQGLLTLSGV